MRFINYTHREGPLGSVFNGDDDDLGGVSGHFGKGNILDQYPLLPEVLRRLGRQRRTIVS